jgi:hypothetical protein
MATTKVTKFSLANRAVDTSKIDADAPTENNQLLKTDADGTLEWIPYPSPYTAGSGISIDENKVITNTAQDQTVSISGSGATSVSGSYPNFTVNTPTVDTSGFITNASDVYQSVEKVTDVVSLTQAEYDALTQVDENTFYVIVG